MTVVVCVYKTGGVYTAQYVEKLFQSCVKHGAKKFICLTDDKKLNPVIPMILLKNDWSGWWSKIELFSLPPDNQYLYFDLDTVINKDITPLLNHKYDKLTMLHDFHDGKPASGVMAWSGSYFPLYALFKPDCHAEIYKKSGDQAYIRDMVMNDVNYFQDLFPNQFVSYKWNTKHDRKQATVICYHGKPKPHETNWSI